MSDLLNSASLVMIPSGYKEDTVFSAIPTDGSGDLSFTRASNGTRVNSAGLVEVCPWNLLEQSETFDTASWPKLECSITANSTNSPIGTLTADSLIESNTNSRHMIYRAFTSVVGQSYSLSVYCKQSTRRYANINLKTSSTASPRFSALFDLQTGLNVSTSAVGSPTGTSFDIVSFPNGWYRISISMNATSTSTEYEISTSNSTTPSLAEGTPAYLGDGTSGIYIWGAQLNIGSTAKPYFPTTDRLNVPRLTYQNGGGGCPSLLLEKQSTNAVFPSEDFSTTWSLYNSATITTNQATSPDGTQNADKITTTNSANALYNVNDAGSSAGDYTASIFVKPINNNSLGLGMTNDTTGEAFVLINVATGVGTTTSQTGWSNATYTWQQHANGWYRITLTATKGSGGAARFILKGNSSSDYYIWGAQLEASSYPTSYIPTTSASATRVADVMTVNLPNTDMTFCAYLECEEAPLGTTATDWLSIYNSSSILGRAYGYANVFGFADAYSLGIASSTKMVWKQESGTTAKLFKNGALAATSTTGTYSNPFNRFAIDGNYLDKPLKVKQFIFFQNNLTDAECASLTA